VNNFPSCLIKLACKGTCQQFKLQIYRINLEETDLTDFASEENESINKYTFQEFGCEPGDKISFINNNSDNNGGIAFYLKITSNSENVVYKAGDNNNILISSPSCSSGTENVQIDEQDVIFCQYSGDSGTFTIKIPYEFEESNKLINNVLYLQRKSFSINEIFSPKITGFQANERVEIKIIELPDSDKADLKKTTNENIMVNNQILLNDVISFGNKENYYGKFTIKFKIIILSEESQEISIDFNVCYIYCATCSQYDNIYSISSSPSLNDFKCNTCKNECYFVIDEDGANLKNRCYSSSEIRTDFSDYFYNSVSLKYEKCHVSCETCIDSSTKCTTCKSGYYFVNGKEPNECYLQSDINTFGYYYLPSISSGESDLAVQQTYFKCDSVCVGCTVYKENCASCISGYYQVQDKGNYCYLPEEIIHLFGKNYYLNGIKYQKCDNSCDYCKLDGLQSKCLKCSEGYFFIEGECKTKSDIENDPDNQYHDYFLPFMSDTYIKCNTNCFSCNYTKDYCIKCIENQALFEDDHKCYEEKVGYYKLDETGIKKFRKCNKSCKKCSLENRCIECTDNYYFVGDIVNGICITEKEKNENEDYYHYYLYNPPEGSEEIKSFKECDPSCKTCRDRNDSCIECVEDFVFYEGGGQKCMDKRTFRNDNNFNNYYYNENLNELRKCHESCSICKDGNINYNCSACANNYAFLDNDTEGKCILESLLNNINYYKDEVNGHYVYKKCNEKCATCESDPNNCLSCNQEKGYYNHGTATSVNCKKSLDLDHKIFDGNNFIDNEDVKCLHSDYDTKRKGSCRKCHNLLGYYSLERGKETCENIIPLDHYVSNNIIKRCAFECASCSEGPTETSTNCDQCKEEYPPSPSNPKNCIFKCPFYFYIYFGNKYCTGENECPSIAQYLIPKELKCTSRCPYVHYYGVCYDSCPSRTYNSYNNNNECKDIGACTLSQFYNIREHLIELNNNNYQPIIKKVKKYKSYFGYTTNHVDVYKHYLNEYTMYIYQNHDCMKELLPNEITLDFSYCNSVINNINNIIIVLIVVPRENLYPKTYYQLYDKTNINPNQNPSLITTNYYCEVHKEIPAAQANLDIKKYKDLYKIGVDLTKAEERFFYDVCFQYYENNKDVVLKKRVNEYFQNPNKICRDYCSWYKADLKYDRAVCSCYTPNNFLNDIYYDNENSYPEIYIGSSTDIFDQLSCFTKNFEDLQIFKNMGSYIIVAIILFEIISIGFYISNGINLINGYVVDLVKKNPPKKINISNDNITNNTIEEKMNKENRNIDSKKKKKNNKVKNNYIMNSNINDIIKNKTNNNYHDNNDVLVGRINKINNQNKYIDKDYQINIKYNNNLIDNNEKPQIYSSTNQLKTSKYDDYVHIFIDFELNSMELYDAIIKDKRSFCYFFILQMKLKQELYKTFCIYEPLFPYSIKIISYLFILSLNLFFNALLYNEDQIYEGTESMSKNISNLFLRAFYSFIIVECIYYIINCLIKNANYLKSLVYRVKKEKQLRVEAYQSIKHIKINFGVFIIIVMIFEILFWFYLSSYCYCYHGEQIELFLGFLVTQLYIEIFCIPLSLYLTVFRFIGLKCKATTCYKISQTFLDN